MECGVVASARRLSRAPLLVARVKLYAIEPLRAPPAELMAATPPICRSV